MRTGADKQKQPTKEELEALIQKGQDTVADAMVYLTSNSVADFYARVINSLDRVSVPGFGTMGVTAQKGRYLMAYDPIFAAEVSVEEVRATCQHEVLHLILEHIPRHLKQIRVFDDDFDQYLIKITANLAMDMSVNELAKRDWPGMSDTENKPLGYWVLPTNLNPPLPGDLHYEAYQNLLMELCRHRLQTSPKKLYQIARAILKKRSQSIKDALNQMPSPEEEDEESEDSQSNPGKDEKGEESEEKGQESGDQGSESEDSEGESGESKSGENQKGDGDSDSDDSSEDGSGEGQGDQSEGKGEGEGQGDGNDALDNAVGGLQPDSQQGPGQGQGQGQQQGQGEGEGSDDLDNAMTGLGEGQGQGQGQGQGDQPGQGQGGGMAQGGPSGGNPYDNMTDEQLQNEISNLDEIDQKMMEMMLNSMPGHLGWEATSEGDSEGDAHKLEEHGREIMKNAVKNADKSRGTIPGNVMELIRKMLMPPTVSWTDFLHNVVQRTRQTKKERGMSRPSKMLSAMKVYGRKLQKQVSDLEEDEYPPRIKKMLGYLKASKRMSVFPGIKHSNKFTIVYAVDTSGSMGTAELQKGLAELQHIQQSDSDVSVCVMYADTQICTEYWIGPSDEIDPKMTGRGGTDFDHVFHRVTELLSSHDKEPDILVYCTDGYAPPPTIRLPIPTVWLITPRGRPCCEEAGHITIEMRDYQLGESY